MQQERYANLSVIDTDRASFGGQRVAVMMTALFPLIHHFLLHRSRGPTFVADDFNCPSVGRQC